MHNDLAQAYIPLNTYYSVSVLLAAAVSSAEIVRRAYPGIGAITREALSTAVALVLAALTAAVLFSLYIVLDDRRLPRPAELLGLISGFHLFFVIFTVCVGGPLFLIVRANGMVRWWSSTLAGALVSAFVATNLRLSFFNLDDMKFLVQLVFAGAASGLVFWIVWRRDAPVKARGDSRKSSSVPSA